MEIMAGSRRRRRAVVECQQLGGNEGQTKSMSCLVVFVPELPETSQRSQDQHGTNPEGGARHGLLKRGCSSWRETQGLARAWLMLALVLRAIVDHRPLASQPTSPTRGISAARTGHSGRGIPGRPSSLRLPVAHPSSLVVTGPPVGQHVSIATRHNS